jgi:hypothetical protein
VPVAAFVPYPPLLLTGVTGGDVPEVDHLRAACLAAVGRLVSAAADRVYVIGPDGPAGALGGVGAPLEGVVNTTLPMSLAVGEWLLVAAGWSGDAAMVRLPDGASAERCRDLGERLQHESLLVLGDGSNRRGPKPPGGPDPRADGFDAGVAAALRDGDSRALAAVAPELADELGATGWPGWQVLAGWAQGRTVAKSSLDYDDAPFGVGYLVGTWSTD